LWAWAFLRRDCEQRFPTHAPKTAYSLRLNVRHVSEFSEFSEKISREYGFDGSKMTMKTRPAILLTIALFLLTSMLGLQLGDANVRLSVFMILGTSIWAAIDSSKIKLKRYKSGISYEPVELFLYLLLLWIVAFPWYLSVRYKILHGQAVMKFSDMALPSA
jgi:hypothetical protein